MNKQGIGLGNPVQSQYDTGSGEAMAMPEPVLLHFMNKFSFMTYHRS
jgi:hypothetical protein